MGLKILLVDDSSTMRAVIRRTVGMTDLELDEILEAASGAEALEVLACKTVDLVLADINMPEMSGIEMTARMQQDDKLKNIPVIVISTDASTTRIKELKDSHGVKGYVHKPFTPEQIRDIVHEVLGVCDAPNN